MFAKTVLVVDDSPLVCRSVGHSLRLGGYVAAAATSAEEAIAYLHAHAPDCMLVDYAMGTGAPDGAELVARVRAHPDEKVRRVAVVGISAHHVARPAFEAAGVNWFLEKPYHHKDLLACVAAAIVDARVAAQAR
jgi:CheY-like chemotaxis protein